MSAPLFTPGRALPVVQHLRLDASGLGRKQPLSGEAADLIVELYEALDALTSFCRAHIEQFRTYNPLTEDADAALAKARGEQ